MLKELIRKNRSYRRFNEQARIEEQHLRNWIDLARMSASARNAQPLKYRLVFEQQECEKLFPNLAWAGYLKDWPGPKKGERPAAYIIMLNDTEIATNYFCDDGIAAQSIMLGAVEAGFGGCMIAAVNRKEIKAEFSIPDQYEVLMVLALGKPIEEVVLEEMTDGDFRYWRDEQAVHHVPKRALDDLIL